jgi:hypothetical protein
MTTESKYRAGIMTSLLGLVMMTFAYLEKDRKYNETYNRLTHTQDSLSTQRILSDSLHDELFIQKVESGRHEFTRDFFFGKHPKLQLEYENYLNHETE